MEKISIEEVRDDLIVLDDENGEDPCPGCNCLPGDGITAACADEMGCGFWRAFDVDQKERFISRGV